MFILNGKGPKDLGNHERCSSNPKLKYALVTITGDEIRQ
jgi:hypothetical protein